MIRPQHPIKLLLLLVLTLWSAAAAATRGPAALEVDPELRSHLLKVIRDEEASLFVDRFDAEVWMMDMEQRLRRFVPATQERITLLRLVHRESVRHGLRPEILLAVIEVESLFDPYAVSSSGAHGLMQVMPFWRKEIGRPHDNLTQTEINVRYGAAILAHYLQRERGNLPNALARYNGSLGQAWYPRRVLSAWRKHWYLGEI